MHQQAEARLQQFADALSSTGDCTHMNHHDDYKAARLFVDLYRQGVLPHTDEVAGFFRSYGWSEEAYKDIARVSEVVEYVMKY